jgi:hypothetical protein
MASVFAGATLSPAQAAAAAPSITTPNGLVGVAQTIVIKAPALKGQVATFSLINGATNLTAQASVNSPGFGYYTWVPTLNGAWTISGQATPATATTTVNAAQMPTSTSLVVPNQMQASVAAPAIINVSAPAGSLAPIGSVTVTSGFGKTIVPSPSRRSALRRLLPPRSSGPLTRPASNR